jgi:hypothetical protein
MRFRLLLGWLLGGRLLWRRELASSIRKGTLLKLLRLMLHWVLVAK